MSWSIGRKRHARRMVVAACAASVVTPYALANNDTWKTAASGTWGQNASWTDNSVPGNNDQATFHLAGTYTASFDTAPAAIQDLFVINSGTNVRFRTDFLGPYTLNVTSATGGRDAVISGGAALTLGGTSPVMITALHLNVGDDLSVGGGSTLNVTQGSQITANDLFLAGSLNLGTGVATIGTSNIGNVAGTAIATVSGAGSQWNNTGELQVGSAGDGRLNVTFGGVVQNAVGRVGVTAGSFGAVHVSGATSQWTSSGNLTIGDGGDGRLTVDGGALVQSTGGAVAIANTSGTSFGAATITGAGSRWILPSVLDVGFRSNGVLDITNGGYVRSASSFLARNSGGHGFVTVTGADSLWEINGSLGIGANGDSSLTITDGGEVRNLSGEGDVDRNSDVTVSDPGSKWTMSSGLFVRGGTVDITDGGLVQSLSGSIGHTQGGSTSGIVTVEGDDSRWLITFGGLSVGIGGGSGTLNINPGGLVNAGAGMNVGNFSGPSTGTVNLNGGELATGLVTVNQTGAFNFNAGTLRFTPANVALGDVMLDQVLGQGHAITPLRHVAVDNIATLQTSLIIDGGTFTAGQLINPQLLHLDRGTLNLTNQAVVIEPGGALGESLDLAADMTVNVTLGITNRRLVAGDGQVGGPFLNDTAGELRATSGQSLKLTGAATNSGRITLFDGLLEFTQTLTNNASGLIVGRGTLIAAGGLTNNGQIQLSGGAGDYFGNLTNTSGAKVIITGNATGTFFDGVTNNAGSEFRVSTGATAVFMGAVSGSAAFTGGGTKIFNGGAPSSVAAIASLVGDTIVDPSTSLTAGHIREDGLEVFGLLTIAPSGTAAGTSKVNTLLIDGGGKLDLKDNKLIVAGGDAGSWNGSAYTGVAGMVDSGRGNAGNALWDGPGIVTSDTRAISNGDLLSVGVAKAGEARGIADTATTTFAGQTVAGADALVMVTWGGDANLDGKINIDDYGRIDGNVGQSGSVFGWDKGDFNYDGKINIDDYGIIDGNINRQGEAFVTSGSAGGVEGVAAVPEPAGFSLLAAAGAGLMRRRRRADA